MRPDWEVKKLGEILEIQRGGSPRPIKNFLTNSPDGINWIKIGDAPDGEKYIYETKEKIKPEGIRSSRLVKEGDFILSNSMSFGRPYIMKTTGCIHDGWLVLRDTNNKINQDFLYYVLSSDLVYRQFDNLASGSTVRNLNINLVSKVEIPLPPLSEQQKIVEILDKALTGIATIKANTERNLQNARELFQSYLQGIFSNPSEDWEVKKLGDVCKINYGYTAKASFEEGNVKFLRITDIQDNNVNWNTVPFCTIDNKVLAKYILETGDIVFARTGATTGKSFLLINPTLSVFASYLIRVKISNLKTLTPEFLFLFFQTEDYWNKISLGISGSAQGGFNATKLAEMLIPIPPLSEQQKIVKKLDTLSAETKRLESVYQEKLEKLEELKKTILHKAFNGELTENQV